MAIVGYVVLTVSDKECFIVCRDVVRDEYESDGSDAGDGDLPRPYTRAELEAKVMNTVRKRESVARRDGFKYDLSIAREKVQKQKDSRK